MKQLLRTKKIFLNTRTSFIVETRCKHLKPVETTYSDVINCLKSHQLKPDTKVIKDLLQKLKARIVLEQ